MYNKYLWGKMIQFRKNILFFLSLQRSLRKHGWVLCALKQGHSFQYLLVGCGARIWTSKVSNKRVDLSLTNFQEKCDTVGGETFLAQHLIPV